ncbi:ash family protein [Aeromonas dhakensis]|nr:ash family protein [Aeromonas dhakensis]MBO2995963.1 ash family protein [Aeromonas dhakensis]NME01791.1 ash family protein [Aeromonas sp. DNRA1]
MVAVGCAILRRQRQNPLPGLRPRLTQSAQHAPACFFVRPSCTRVMTGWAGQPHGWPVSLGTGSLNPVQLVTSSRLRPLW